MVVGWLLRTAAADGKVLSLAVWLGAGAVRVCGTCRVVRTEHAGIAAHAWLAGDTRERQGVWAVYAFA